jgi:hypothetical protein
MSAPARGFLHKAPAHKYAASIIVTAPQHQRRAMGQD